VLTSAPDELEGVNVVEHLDARLPMDLEFTDSDGRRVKLGQLFDGTRPVILTMNYSSCPMLCHLQLNGLFVGLEKLDWTIGDKFRMITVSINPQETFQRAASTKAKYLKNYGRAEAGAGWHFLTGKEENIRKLAGTVGFGYRYDPKYKQYVHLAVLMVCTPDGRVSRYLYGIEYDPQTLRLALLEAGEGRIGTTYDKVLLYCFHYEPTTGKYSLAAVRLMQAGGLVTVAVLGSLLSVYWWRERRKVKNAKPRGGE